MWPTLKRLKTYVFHGQKLSKIRISHVFWNAKCKNRIDGFCASGSGDNRGWVFTFFLPTIKNIPYTGKIYPSNGWSNFIFIAIFEFNATKYFFYVKILQELNAQVSNRLQNVLRLYSIFFFSMKKASEAQKD